MNKSAIEKLWLTSWVILWVLSGCQNLTGEDVRATISAEQIMFATEASGFEHTAILNQNAVQITVEAAGTQAAEINNINRVLVATVRSGEIPTPQIVPGVMDASSVESQSNDMMEAMDDGSVVVGELENMQFVQLNVASEINREDGCALITQTAFPDVGRVYFTMVANNLQQGTQFSVEWRTNDQIVDRSTWTATSNESRLCIWFYTDGPFAPGNWTATLYANGKLISPIVQFTVNPA